MLRKLILAVTLVGAATVPWSESHSLQMQEPPKQPETQVTNMKIRITIGGKSITATLADNQASRDFAAMLPLRLTLKDYADNEKISDLPKKLSTKGAPPGYDPSAGDITYYAPWGNLALFHKDGHYSTGLVKIGTIDSGAEILSQPGALKATFARTTD